MTNVTTSKIAYTEKGNQYVKTTTNQEKGKAVGKTFVLGNALGLGTALVTDTFMRKQGLLGAGENILTKAFDGAALLLPFKSSKACKVAYGALLAGSLALSTFMYGAIGKGIGKIKDNKENKEAAQNADMYSDNKKAE